MKIYKNTLLVLLLGFFLVGCEQAKEIVDYSMSIPTKGNSWVVNDLAVNEAIITKKGIENWNNDSAVIRTYFKLDTIGEIQLGILGKAIDGEATLKVSFEGKSQEVTMRKSEFDTIPVGTFKVNEPGYKFVEIQGLEKKGATFGAIEAILIGGTAVTANTTFVKEDFYWGRRGPSVHLRYETPKDIDVEWFYNEITVPEGNDVLGSYFMANGFGEGYFGMQVNSSEERRILFSVWSPFKTQNPKEIPDDYKIILLEKGQGVTTGEFGNEGSGGQSFKVFNWKAGITYKFLLKGVPSVNNSTDYTAYFFDGEANQWHLIASFRRPHTSTYLKRQHSFLENFRTETGFLNRKGFYGNQWVLDAKGNWHELTKAKFTADNTARKGSRLDYAGGAEGNVFFMTNCGFFDDTTPIDSEFTRKENGETPTINFEELPKGI
ncbi:DUF3472 domain-containing protein [Joostella sp. CR20]|uniref:DUF3472 domain-containing protein n=1 Tax=Joostella sp. CR20 TaxID=2804312 RepID=UPI00313C893E